MLTFAFITEPCSLQDKKLSLHSWLTAACKCLTYNIKQSLMQPQRYLLDVVGCGYGHTSSRRAMLGQGCSLDYMHVDVHLK